MAVDPAKVTAVAEAFERDSGFTERLAQLINDAMKAAGVNNLTDEEVVALLIALGLDYHLARYSLAHT